MKTEPTIEDQQGIDTSQDLRNNVYHKIPHLQQMRTDIEAFKTSCTWTDLHNPTMVLRGRCSFANTSRTTARSRVVLILFISIDHSTPPLFGSRHCMGSLGFRWSYADNFGVLTRGANATNVHIASLILRGPVSMFTTHPFTSGRADVLGFEVSPANAYCSGPGKRISRI